MTPAARAAAAITVLDEWLGGKAAEQALTNWARGARYAGSKDRAAVRDLVYDALRARASCERLGGGLNGRAMILGLFRLQGADPNDIFNDAGYGPGALEPHETACLAEPVRIDPVDDIPAWLQPRFASRAGDALSDLAQALHMRAPLYLRVNTRKATRHAAIAALADQGVTCTGDPRVETALLVTSGARQVKSSQAYREGWIEPQDLSVQRAVMSVSWPDGRILDYCAGGGGKALAIAALTGRRVLAYDAAPARMADLPVRAARAGAMIDIVHADRLAQAGAFAAVVCDVPCSGSGTWRRDPEAKWRLTPARLDALIALQAQILDEARHHVTPGGMLVYMTCSLFYDENEDQIAAFLARHPAWRCESVLVDTPLTASDGFFHAVLRAPS